MEFSVCDVCMYPVQIFKNIFQFNLIFFTIVFMLETDFASLQVLLSHDSDRAAS